MGVSGKRRNPNLDKGCGEETQMELSGKKRDPDLDKRCGEEKQMEVSGKRREPDLDKGCGEERQMEVSGKRREPDLDKGCGEETQMEVSGKRRDTDLDKGCGEETQMEVSGKRRDSDFDKGCRKETQMEVSGKRRDPDLDKGSANTTVYCQPCEEGVKRTVAQGFCQTCKEYMCDPCIEAHTRLKVSMDHIILSKEKILPFYQSARQAIVCDTEYCKVHTTAMVKFYCPTHRFLGCVSCVMFDHGSCKLDYIADLAKEFVDGKVFRQLGLSINRADDLLSGSATNVKELLDEVENHSKDEIERLIKFRAEINAYLDCRERELLESMQKIKYEDVILLTALNTDCQ
ncbi:E3 ubiquitin-protein ligase TRIM33-like [Mya arenaria]|uniref:E3 ubiquitin-protein ligase TRIM33-like n=1 Tax=Mya arenaria TaxID=6604 RepID=UPI0022E354DD|nr:E3 ubiquitin-protein ligase TRIM33-like [Mya arenaria]